MILSILVQKHNAVDVKRACIALGYKVWVLHASHLMVDMDGDNAPKDPIEAFVRLRKELFEKFTTDYAIHI